MKETLVLSGPGTIPTVLPIYRGIHLCNSNFVKKFRDSYSEPSRKMAERSES